MKKFIAFLFVLSLLCTPAFALVCEQSQAANGSDACWTQVTVDPDETTLVSAGTVLVSKVAYGGTDTRGYAGDYLVRVATASTDGAFVMGVAQKRIKSGETALVLVRGLGDIKVKTNTTITSGDALWVSSSGDTVSASSSTTIEPIAFALQTSAASGNTFTTKKAYIKIV